MADGPPRDDPAIPDEECLYRRLHSSHVSWNPNGSVKKIGKNAFQDSSEESPCSIAIGGLLASNGLEPDDLLAGYPSFGLAIFTAGDARECGFGVISTPRSNEPAHGNLTGDKGPAGPRRKLAGKARVLRPPTPPDSS
jgi:hypothetical protein